MRLSYLLRVEKALCVCQLDIPMMQAAAEAAPERLARGGRLLVGGDRRIVGELSGRAGGLMLTRDLADSAPQNRDVILFTPQPGDGAPKDALDSGALVVVLGSRGAPPHSASPGQACARAAPGVFCFENHAQEAGISPTMANAIPAWIFTGELIAALTRLGKMPAIYESIGLPAGVPRMQDYCNQGIFWHEEHGVAPIAPGVMGNAYVQAVAAMLRRVEQEQRENINRAGEWAAQAKHAGKQLWMYSMGHIFPAEVERTAIGETFRSGEWNSGFSDWRPPEDACYPGDVLMHIGYQHPPTVMLQRARRSGARVVYVDVLQDRDYARDEGVIWIDPMWPWGDACVPIAGYDVPALASSGIANAAIAWEIWRVTRTALDEL